MDNPKGKIAFVSSLFKPTQINVIGGQETLTALLVQQLAKRNYNINLFALNYSLKSNRIRLKIITDYSLDGLKNTHPEVLPYLDKIKVALYGRTLIELEESNDQLIFDSSGDFSLSLSADKIKKPIIIIGHFPVINSYVSIFKYIKQPKNVYFVFPSRFQINNSQWLSNKFFIPHGIEIEKYKCSEKPRENSFFWIGRVPDHDPKGLLESINVSLLLKLNLKGFAAFDHKYFVSQKINPLLNSNIEIVNTYEQNVYDKYSTPSNYKLLLQPLKWDEPFGLVMIEAMACGTPVVAYARGSVPELVKDGETGFIVNSSEVDNRGDWIVKKTGIEGIQEAVERIYSMPDEEYKQMRKKCRAHVEKNFTADRMIDQYEDMYKKVIEFNKNNS